MNPKTTLTMGLALVVVFATLAILKVTHAPTQKEIEETKDRVIGELHDVENDDLTQISLSRDRETYEFAFSESTDRWHMNKPLSVLAQTSSVQSVFSDLKNLRKATGRGADEKAGLIEPKTAADLVQYGLDAPKSAITVTFKPKGSEKETNSITLHVGGTTADKEGYYVKLSSKPYVYVVKKSDLRSLEKKASEFRQQKLVTLGRYDADLLRLEWPDRQLAAEKKDNKWRLTQPVEDRADENKLGELIAKLGDLKADGDEDFVAETSDDAKFGFDSPQLVAEIRKPGSGAESDFSDTKDDKKKAKSKEKPAITEKVLIGKPVEGRDDRVYAKLADQKYVIAVAASVLGDLAKQPSDVRSRDLVELTERDVDYVRVERTGGAVELGKKDLDWELFQPKAIRAENTAVAELVKKIDDIEVKEFIDQGDAAEFGLDQPAITVSIYQKGLKTDDKDSSEKKSDAKDEQTGESADAAPQPAGTPTRVAFGMRDDEKKLVYVRRGDEPTIFGVASEGLWDVIDRDYLAYRRKQVLSFLEADAAKLSVDRDGKTFTVERKKENEGDTKETWRLTEPLDAPADATSISDIMFTITRLNAKKFFAEGEVDLAQYGLSEPKVRATVSLKTSGDKDPEPHVLLIGGEADGGGHYAKLAKNDLVFSVEQTLVSYLTAELHDHALLKFDSSKVEGLTLTWPNGKLELTNKKAEGKPVKEWSVVDDDEFKLDANKPRSLVNALAFLNTDKFAQYAGDFTEAHSLDKPALLIEIKLDGEADPKTLRIGAADDDRRFAATGEKSGPVALLLEDRFKEFLVGPSAFAVAEEKKPEPEKSEKPEPAKPDDVKKEDKPEAAKPDEKKSDAKQSDDKPASDSPESTSKQSPAKN